MPPASAPVDYIAATRDAYAALGYSAYRWVRSEEPPPWAVLRRPFEECRIALIASGGIYVAGQIAFHFKDDTSFRRIPTDVATEELRATHFAYDLTDARRDPNVVFPIDTLRRLAPAMPSNIASASTIPPSKSGRAPARSRVHSMDTLAAECGRIGGLTRHAFTFMGGIYSSRRVRDELAPAIARAVVDEGADAALLVPV